MTQSAHKTEISQHHSHFSPELLKCRLACKLCVKCFSCSLCVEQQSAVRAAAVRAVPTVLQSVCACAVSAVLCDRPAAPPALSGQAGQAGQEELAGLDRTVYRTVSTGRLQRPGLQYRPRQLGGCGGATGVLWYQLRPAVRG